MADYSMNKIDVKVQPAYIAEQSDPKNNLYVFSYTVTIKNNGSIPAKLLTRHWVITDGDGQVQEVRGDGVIGEQPHLRPGEGFQYTSGTFMNTPFGTMQGSYEMIADTGEKFDAEIAPFQLAAPNTLH
ncbi:MAG: Co2+/Mg2+ efflux protein ApaG [Gammaproteobacteria bacterium]|nr:MAG: Co2+/Mg2+ efflux protein ApaG [Gammaproteobacteria bacterium]